MRTIAYVLLATLIVSFAAWSQSERGIECYLGGGISFLSGPPILKAENKMGFNAKGGIDFGFEVLPSVSLIVGIDHTSFPKDETRAREEVVQQIPASDRVGSGISVGDGGTLSILTISASAKILLGSRDDQVTPYVVAGAGVLSMSISDITASYVYSNETSVPVSTYHPVALKRSQFKASSSFMTSIGAGIDMPFGDSHALFVEGGYAAGFTSFGNTTYIPVRLGVRFGL